MFRSLTSLIRVPAFRFATEAPKTAPNTKAIDKAKAKADNARLTLYKNGELTTRTAIALKSQEDVQSYVIKTVQNYFRTTYREGTIMWT